MYIYLHFNLIGNDCFDGLHKQCKELIIIVNKEIVLGTHIWRINYY